MPADSTINFGPMRILPRALGALMLSAAVPLFFSCEKHYVGELPEHHGPGHKAHGEGHGDKAHGHEHKAGEDHHAPGHAPATDPHAHGDSGLTRSPAPASPTPADFFPDKQP